MKTRLLFSLTLCLVLNSCIKDYIGDGPKDVSLTEENHLSSGELFTQYADEEIMRLDNIIGNPSDYSDEEVEAANELRASLKLQIAATVDIYSVSDLPRPCPNDPGGKCVPSRLEYFIFPSNILEALVRATAEDGSLEGVSDELQPLPGFESDLQFIRVPIENVENSLELDLAWKDSKGQLTSFTVIRSN